MGNSDLCERKDIMDQEGSAIRRLKLEIDVLKDELNKAIIEKKGKKMDHDIIEMSQKLDELIVKYSMIVLK
ncbi:MAG: aspartyl-phosphate phosphatase Spo0E family protein [Tissierellaceae bacterium]|nr:aspartyl-phosphate phosphatase Spo0E family protein [Tissierellaceae bacterium]